MVVETLAKRVCGNCGKFRIEDADGDPTPKKIINGMEAQEGFCNAPLGLVVGIVNELACCRRPESFIEKYKQER